VKAALDIPVLESQRLRLRAWREGDLEPYAHFCANPATARFLGGVCGREDAWRRLAAFLGHWVLRGYGNWAIEEKTTGRWIGYSGLWQPEGWPEAEVMWGLAADRQGQGYATEAGRCAREFAYRELGWSTLVSYIAPANAPSQQVAARLSAVHERDLVLRGAEVGLYRHPSAAALRR
jgi:RimJ/RimL family protein N-acetyltransferase